MILVDRALERRESRPVRVGLVGAGFMASGIALHIARYVKGMAVAGIINRTPERAVRVCNEAGLQWRAVDSSAAMERAIENGLCGVSENYADLCKAGPVDAIVEVTGSVEYGCAVALSAIENGKHIVLMNAELDGTLGPLLKLRADKAGVVYTNSDGDQPGVTMNLYRFVRGIGVNPVLCGNIKGLHDPNRNPATQEGFARKWGQNPYMVTSFADGTKISFEQAIVANATGMSVAQRGMLGPTVPAGTPVHGAASWYPKEALEIEGGIVDYVVGAAPGPGVFVLGKHDHPRMRHYLDLYKIEGSPYYCFHTPYHLCHFEVPNTVARAVLFGDAAIAPIGGPRVEVVAAAKVDLEEGTAIDALGGFTAYGLCENYPESRRQGLLPIGLAEGCRLKHRIRKGEVLALFDVEIPAGRLCDRLRAEQDTLFPA